MCLRGLELPVVHHMLHVCYTPKYAPQVRPSGPSEAQRWAQVGLGLFLLGQGGVRARGHGRRRRPSIPSLPEESGIDESLG